MFNKEEKEEKKTVISMDMGGTIEPVEIPKEEEVKEEIKEERSTVVPELMKIGNEDEVPNIIDTLPEPVVPTPTIAPAPTPTIGEVKPPVKEETKVEVKEVKEETPSLKVEASTPIVKVEEKKELVEPEIKPAPKVVPTPTITPPTPTIGEVPRPPKEDLDKTMTISKVDDKASLQIGDVKVEEKEETVEEKVDLGPNVIAEPLATEDEKKEKKKDPHFFECPPDCIPIRPFGYIGLNILYNIPIIGLIMILVHSASYKNLNRRNYARSYLLTIILVILIIAALVYFLKIDLIKIIENITGYKIDLQHFKFTKFK